MLKWFPNPLRPCIVLLVDKVQSDNKVLRLVRRKLISEFFANRADEAMEQLWSEGTWNEQTLADLKKAHYRTPYFFENLPI